ncbi:MAG TPA: hypothetical protein VF817_00390 [Patescibacteria group bacterium]
MENTTKTTEKTFTANEVGTMIEKFEKASKSVSENTDRKIDQLGSVIERFDEKLTTLAESMDIKFEGVYSRLDRVEDRLDKVETKIDRLQDDVVDVKYELKRKIDVEQFKSLEKRVVKLEKLSLSH